MRYLAIIALISLVACGGGGGTQDAIVPGLPPQSERIYASLGDSVTFGDFASDPATQGYVPVVASTLGYTFVNLGIRGETSLNILSDELPLVPSNATLITVYIGLNDATNVMPYGADSPQAMGNVSLEESAFASNLRALVSELPRGARVFVANIPNLANIYPWTMSAPAIRMQISAMVTNMDQTIDALGVKVVDLRCSPAVYDPANYERGVHPNTQGHARYAQLFAEAIYGTQVESKNCAYMNPL